MAKMLFDLQRGVIEIDGDEEFVERVYSDIKETMLGKLGSIAQLAADTSDADEEEPLADAAKRSRRRARSAGPSCASRIEAFKTDDFFGGLRTAKEITDKLREKGTAYEGKRVAAALLHLTSKGKLRRMQEAGVWKYQNP